ncbi:unnamed protein product, partial [Mesorhabditis belari]|uniref:Uncharacterized protein n=1 Tax=Mesorhabditis belari TaxID=2138241 RepID=A0AAF3J5B4_9BILA
MLLLFGCFLLFTTTFGDVGTCNHTVEPLSWLTTTGRGLADWSSAGIRPNGPNYCLQGNRQDNTVEVNYHMNISADSIPLRYSRNPWIMNDDNTTQNGCLNKDPRIKYCFSFCTADLENLITKAALKFRIAYQLAAEVYENYGSPKDVAVTTIELSLTDPNAHLDVQVFMLPCWCSVYVGIHPDFGPSYLYEIQVAHLLT